MWSVGNFQERKSLQCFVDLPGKINRQWFGCRAYVVLSLPAGFDRWRVHKMFNHVTKRSAAQLRILPFQTWSCGSVRRFHIAQGDVLLMFPAGINLRRLVKGSVQKIYHKVVRSVGFFFPGCSVNNCSVSAHDISTLLRLNKQSWKTQAFCCTRWFCMKLKLGVWLPGELLMPNVLVGLLLRCNRRSLLRETALSLLTISPLAPSAKCMKCRSPHFSLNSSGWMIIPHWRDIHGQCKECTAW